MMSPHSDDEALLAELAEALREGASVPTHYVDAAQAALSWRTVDAELAIAELTFDSACDPEPAGATRGGSARTLAFRGGELSVEIEVTDAGIAGQVIPASGGQVEVQTAMGAADSAPIDEIGCFVLGAPPAGPVRLHARTGRHRIATSWVSLAAR
ncbi:MAG TPA: hypothetical protein VJT31_02160 [Rugosimonospora sp.]|nr:hypothetical protein [Rugosimonospora sp.]